MMEDSRPSRLPEQSEEGMQKLQPTTSLPHIRPQWRALQRVVRWPPRGSREEGKNSHGYRRIQSIIVRQF